MDEINNKLNSDEKRDGLSTPSSQNYQFESL